MSNKTQLRVRKVAASDPRIARTTHALGRALVDLIQEHSFDEITVQQILDRAGVGRTAFYAHYRNKEDVLHSSYERMIGTFEALLDAPGTPRGRLFPVREFLSHLQDENAVLVALRKSGQLDELLSMLVEYAARIIVKRLPPGASDEGRALGARMLSGALVESVKWWEDHRESATPGEMDAAFHAFAGAIVRQH